MNQRIKGKCKYCGKEYTMSYMNRHLPVCKERQNRLAAETGDKQCGYFELAVCSKYSRNYWLFIEVRETATLKDVDSFLRDIWLECCGHLSAFNINGINYDVEPYDDFFGGVPAKSMNSKLNSVLRKGMTIDYEYDFGSTTELMITVVNYRIGQWKKEKLTILSRNNPPILLCDVTIHSRFYLTSMQASLRDDFYIYLQDEKMLILSIFSSFLLPSLSSCVIIYMTIERRSSYGYYL